MSDNGTTNGLAPPCVGLRIRGLEKCFGALRAVDGVDLDVPSGGTCALLGPSGCGKTTTLRMIAGLERPDAGEIAVGGRVVSGPGCFVPAEERRIGMVFQDYALFPHMDVAANVGYGLGRKPDPARVREADHLQQFLDAHLAIRPFQPMQAECDVGSSVEMRKQRVVLEHHADASPFGRHAETPAAHEHPVQPDFARCHGLEAGDTAQHRGFSAAARA